MILVYVLSTLWSGALTAIVWVGVPQIHLLQDSLVRFQATEEYVQFEAIVTQEEQFDDPFQKIA